MEAMEFLYEDVRQERFYLELAKLREVACVFSSFLCDPPANRLRTERAVAGPAGAKFALLLRA